MMRVFLILLFIAAPVLPAQLFAGGQPHTVAAQDSLRALSAWRLALRYPAAQRELRAARLQGTALPPQRATAWQLPATADSSGTTGIRPGRLWLVGGTMFAVNAGIMGYYFVTFYNDEYADRAPFHTFNDWYNADLNVDKLGHIWGSQTYTRTLFHMFRWTGMDDTPAMYWSSGLAMFYQLEMEVIDGMYEKWGFSWWDMGANTVGSLWPNLQRVWPSLQAVNLKMSYHPSDAVKAGWIEHDYLRDYDGFTYWLCLSVEDVLPDGAKPYWPDWLGIAVGYGANRTMLGDGIFNSSGGVGQGEQEWYVALDYDMRALPGEGAFMDFVRESLNLFHFPAPAIRITPSGIFYGLYF